MSKIKIDWSTVPAGTNIAINCDGAFMWGIEDEHGNIRSSTGTCDYIINEFTVIERRPAVGDNTIVGFRWLDREYEQLGLIIVKGDKILRYGEIESFAWRHHETDQPRDDYQGAVELDDSGYWRPLVIQNPRLPVVTETPAQPGTDDTDYRNAHVSSQPDHITTSVDILNQAVKEQGDRAATYDAPSGERSMGKTVAMFNILTGFNVTEEQGWQFMELLKMVRSSQGNFKMDNYVDGSGYASLAGESALRDRGDKS